MTGYTKIKFKYIDDEGEKIESIWASKYGEFYKIENIPFYVKSYALGDIVSVEAINGEHFVQDLIEESGNSTIHLVFFKKDIVQKTRDYLKEMECVSELSNIPSLISINVPKSVNYNQKVKPFLDQGFESKLWDYQEACLAQ